MVSTEDAASFRRDLLSGTTSVGKLWKELVTSEKPVLVTVDRTVQKRGSTCYFVSTIQQYVRFKPGIQPDFYDHLIADRMGVEVECSVKKIGSEDYCVWTLREYTGVEKSDPQHMFFDHLMSDT